MGSYPYSGKTQTTILQKQIETLNANIDKLYMDKLSGVLSEQDFIRISKGILEQRDKIQNNLQELEIHSNKPKKKLDIEKIIENFIKMEQPTREILCELIDRIELTKNKELIINYNFAM